MKLNIYTDGGARGNPGPAAIGIYITDEKNNTFYSFAKTIGETTNNVAEYTSVLEAFQLISKDKNLIKYVFHISFYLDSLLVVSQLNGIYKIKNTKLKEIFLEIKKKEKNMGIDIIYSHIPREQNRIADSLVNQALDREQEK